MALELIDTIHLVLRMLLGPSVATSQVPPPLTVPSWRCPRRAARPLTDRCVRARCGRLPYISASRLPLDAQAAASLSCCVAAGEHELSDAVGAACRGGAKACIPDVSVRVCGCIM